MLSVLILSLAAAAVVYGWILVRAAIARGQFGVHPEGAVLSAVTNFFDTLGIGSFAPTLAWFKLRGLAPDRLIPPTMVVGHCLPAIVQAAVFLVLLGVRVDPLLIVGCGGGLLAGGLVGAPLVARAPVRLIQGVVGVALIVAAALYALSNLHLMPAGGSAGSLPPIQSAVAVGASFIMGILLNFGIGHYAPSLILLSLMGMDPRLCFPIMAFGGAATISALSVRHISIGEIDLKVVLGMALGGIPAVLVAAFAVKSMPVEVLRWLVIVVVLYAAAVMLRAAARPSPATLAPAQA